MLEERNSFLQDKSTPINLTGMSIPDRLKQARKFAGLTQRALAEKAGITQATVSDLERGLARSSVHLVKMAIICGVRPQWLAEGSGEMTPPPGIGTLGLEDAQKQIAQLRNTVDSAEDAWTKGQTAEEKEIAEILWRNTVQTMMELRGRVASSTPEQADLINMIGRVKQARVTELLLKLAEKSANRQLSDSDLDFLEGVIDRVGS